MYHGPALLLLQELLQERLNLVDVGARGGFLGGWTALDACANFVGFEADAEECARLNAATPANRQFIPAMLGRENGEVDFHVTREPGSSSIYRPRRSLVERYPPLGILNVEQVVRLPCTTLDGALESAGIPSTHILKLDAQGAELDILMGGRDALASCCLVDTEVEFNPMYVGQPLFKDVDGFLRANGFMLWRFENLVHYAPRSVPAAGSGFTFAHEPSPCSIHQVPNGQVFWAQVQYVRGAHTHHVEGRLGCEEAIRAALCVGLYGFWDLSLDIARKSCDAALLERLDAVLKLPGF